MRVALHVLIGLLVVIHLFFFVLEAVIWDTAAAADFRKSLNFKNADQSEVARVGVNQGLCNAFLATGLAWGLWGYRRGRPEGRPILTFFLAFIVLAGLVGYFSINPDLSGSLAFLIGQSGLAMAALASLHGEGSPGRRIASAVDRAPAR